MGRLVLGLAAGFLVLARAAIVAAEVDATLPPNLETNLAFRPFIEHMWRTSPILRRQCRRLAAEPRLRVRVLPQDDGRREASHDARTVVRLKNGVVRVAEVYLRASPDAPKLIAHELEHILEQLDGVDLRAHDGKGAAWKSGDTSFETRRAIETGLRVADELASGENGPMAPRAKASASADARLITAPQQLGDRTPFAPRTVRASAGGRYVVFISSSRLVPEDWFACSQANACGSTSPFTTGRQPEHDAGDQRRWPLRRVRVEA